jgi:ElaB/YqjD/DUF883 family membrane-anchored ribosome-binding protein
MITEARESFCQRYPDFCNNAKKIGVIGLSGLAVYKGLQYNDNKPHPKNNTNHSSNSSNTSDNKHPNTPHLSRDNIVQGINDAQATISSTRDELRNRLDKAIDNASSTKDELEKGFSVFKNRMFGEGLELHEANKVGKLNAFCKKHPVLCVGVGAGLAGGLSGLAYQVGKGITSKPPYVDPNNSEKRTQLQIEDFKNHLKDQGLSPDEIEEVIKSGQLHDTILQSYQIAHEANEEHDSELNKLHEAIVTACETLFIEE